MKKTIAILTLLILVVACGKSKKETPAEQALKQLQTERAKVQKQMDALAKQLADIDFQIEALDTVKKNVLVKSTILKDTVFTHYIELQGNVETKENILVYPEFSGTLTSLNVRGGQSVAKGQILARIDDGGLSAQLAQAETQYQLAKTTYERQKNLWDQKIGSEIQFLQAKTNMESQQKVINQIKAQLNKTLVRAPFSGTVDEVNVERGQVVSPGMPLFRVVSTRDMYVSANVPENYIQNLKLNASVEVFIPSLDKNYQGKIRVIGKNINPNNRTVSVEISVSNTDQLLRPNQVATIKIQDYQNANAIVILDTHYNQKPNGDKVVYVVQNKKNNEASVKEITIEVGKTQNNLIEVLSGLQPGFELVTEGIKNIKDDTKVTILN